VSLLSVIAEVTGRLALPQPTAVVGSTDQQVIQLLALTNKAGHDLAQAHNWQALMAEETFTTVNQTTQTGAIPADFDRFVPNSFYNRTTRRPVIGPVTPQQWQALAAQPSLNTVYLMFRERQGAFLMGPPSVPPPAGQTIAYEYVSKNWAKSSGGTPQASYLADTDLTYLDESLLADAVVWMFLRAKGFSYAEELATFSRNLDQQRARDGGSSALSLTPSPLNLDRVNLPDGDFPAPV
jgi:hypothetical protein